MKKAIVIGSGIAGLASAIHLNVKGYEVHIYEKNASPGGKITELKLGDFRFDAGPSLFTMPHFVDELFILAGKKPSDYFTYSKNETACHYFFEDGTVLPFSSDKEKTCQLVERTLRTDAGPLRKQFEKSAFIYEKTHAAFLERSLHRISSYFSKAVLICFSNMHRLNLFTTMHKANVKTLKHPKLVQIFDRFATYNGSDPYQAPGILNIIPHLEYEIGSFFPVKGMHSITTSLVQLAKELGVVFHLGQEVQEITYSGKKVRGIKAGNKEIPADLVFCNSDIRLTYKHLLPKLKIPKQVGKQEASSSALIFYWGIKGQFQQLDLHNIFFSENYPQEFEAIFKKKSVSPDPTVYVHISSKKVGSDAPEGMENWFVMVNVPSASGQDWDKIRQETKKNILVKLNRMLDTDLEKLIVEEDFLDPVRIENRTSSFGGALYGASSNKRMAAFFRHPNFSRIKGLYFVGGSVHPGGGIPLCLLSAKIACSEVKDQENLI